MHEKRTMARLCPDPLRKLCPPQIPYLFSGEEVSIIRVAASFPYVVVASLSIPLLSNVQNCIL